MLYVNFSPVNCFPSEKNKLSKVNCLLGTGLPSEACWSVLDGKGGERRPLRATEQGTLCVASSGGLRRSTETTIPARVLQKERMR